MLDQIFGRLFLSQWTVFAVLLVLLIGLSDIQHDGVFFTLDRLIVHLGNDQNIHLSRNTVKTMREVKQLGDTAAHDRTYITPQIDIDDVKARYRRLIKEPLLVSGVTK